MKRVFGMFEAVFDGIYLLAALAMGLVLLAGRTPDAVHLLAAAMALVLAGGDAFHLIPRIRLILARQESTALNRQLGRGKQITSVTMTVFYLLLWTLAQQLFPVRAGALLSGAVYLLAAVRIALCLLPQNRWTDRRPPARWGLYRNIPFFLLGFITALKLFLERNAVPALQWMWLSVLLSFLFYLPVALWVNRRPKLGMLMLPKTCMYLWMLAMTLRL